MSQGKWTTEQYSAITAGTSNLLIAAAAGAGKTAVLVERITRKVTADSNPVDIDKLLVVTFTKAAASQMRERLGKAINKLLEEQPESKSLQRQLTLLGKASITTIHSFCLEVIQSNFHSVDLDPGFRIADETEALLLKLEALDELFEQHYEDENYDESFFRLLNSFSGSRDDKALQDIVLGVYNFIQSHPWPMEWMRSSAQNLNLENCTDFGATKYARVLKDTIRIDLSSFLLQLQEALDIVNTAEGLMPYNEAFTQDLSNLQLLLKHCSEESTWDDLYHAFQSIEFIKLGRCGKEVDKEKQEQVKDVRDHIKKKLRSLNDTVVYADSEGICMELTTLYPMFDCLYRLVGGFEEAYRAKKKQKGLIDFNDLEHYCLRILTAKDEDGRIVPSEAALAYRNRFDEIYIDEYQDSNEVQEVILNMISKCPVDEHNIFMVGDVKQSIYRFRQAKPELFKYKYDTYSSEEGSSKRKILLNKNFRSRKEILDATNFVFRLLMNDTVGELDYNDNEALNLGASYQEIIEQDIEAGGPIELNIIDMGSTVEAAVSEEEDEDNEAAPQLEEQEDMDTVRCEAVAAADKIKSLLDFNREKPFMVYDEGEHGYRPLKYSDIVILMRSTKNWVDVFVEELTKRDIPVYADTGGGYLKTTEISTMTALLQIVDNPIQDIPLLAVLRSPIGGFTSEELIDIRVTDKEAFLFEAMQKLAGLEEEASSKCRAFLNKLELWRSKATQLSTAELIWYLYNDTGYFSYASAMPGGLQRQANLKLLFEKARQFEETSLKGLFNFVNFIDKLKGSSGDMGGAKILGENANVVRIMSIHKSKGLEFPVVILAGTGKGFNLMDMNKSILLHQDLGFGPDFVDYEKRISYATAAKQALRYKIKLESLSEEMRILYVALTRAKEKLIIFGTVNNLNSAAARWKCKLDNEESGTNTLKLASYDVLRCKNYLDWICNTLYLHPQGSVIRTIKGDDTGCHDKLSSESSRFDIRLISKQEILSASLQTAKEDFINEFSFMEEELPKQYSPHKDEIIKRLQWEYPYKLMNALPVKITVSELKRRFDSNLGEESANMYLPPLVQKPRFLEESKTMSAAEKGTIMHFVMQHLDIKAADTKEEIHKQLELMLQMELITEEQKRSIDADKILKLIHSTLGKRMLAASIHREVPFNMEISCTEIYKDLDADKYGQHMVMLQGVIDCYFEEADGLILVDYKTDYVNNNIDLIQERYKVQIDCYTKALETITGKKVVERYIYLFYNGEILEM
ncbi:MAG: recombination helicase AddA [Clostridia bacterium]|jgi:ATP-dependent helicase/nuclease subunit A|nr:recombination helicase AddA [Clostridia bacterium]